jgi:RHS repeat-associated protein
MLTRVVDGVTTTFAYNADNKLTTVSRGGSTIATFVYDGDGTRVQSTINGVATKFVGEYYEVTGTVVTKYYGGAAMRVGGVLTYLLSDHLGSNSLILDTAGNVVGETRYTAWGEERYSNGTVSSTHTYTGQYSNTDDFGLMYYKARWYDPQLGRFAQADSIVPGAGNPLAWDRYAYVFNNPIIRNDPSGHCASSDTACVDALARIQKSYKVKIYDKKGLWTLEALLAIETGMQDLMDKIGSDTFYEKFTDVQYTIDGTTNNMYTTGNNDIHLDPVLVNGHADYITHETVHELAHIWDNSCNDCLSKELLTITNGKQTDAIRIFGLKFGEDVYTPGGEPPTDYGTKNRQEDWAESVTSVIYPGYADEYDWDQQRRDFVAEVFNR